MSIRTWKEEFYPKRAQETTKAEALDHSILKWIGLRPENLAKHEMRQDVFGCLRDTAGDKVFVDSSTCALCHHHRGSNNYVDDNACNGCPLFEVRDRVQCDAARMREADAPYFLFMHGNDPEPMIVDLLRAKRAIDEGAL